MSNSQNLIWIDLEMTGLDPKTDQIIEIAVIVTDPNLEIIAKSPAIAIFQPDEVLENMNDWCKKVHKENNLIERVKQSKISLYQAEQQILEFLKPLVPKGCSPICGNSVHQDKRFLYEHMPTLAEYFHYRHIDVSTFKELAKRWSPELLTKIKKHSSHLALEDIEDSINELKFYRNNFLK